MPELLEHRGKKIDFQLKIGSVQKALKKALHKGTLFESAPNELLLEMPGVARYLLKDGKKLTIEKLGNTWKRVRLYILGSMMGAALMQKDKFVLHANTIWIDGRAVAFSGMSGAGKSTITGALLERGHKLIADDVTSIYDVGGEPLVDPGFPRLKLWEDSARALGHNPDKLERVMKGQHKYSLFTRKKFIEEPTRLERVYMLNSVNEKKFDVEKISGIHKYQMLKNNAYRQQFLYGLGLESQNFKQCMNIAQKVEVKSLVRPSFPFMLNRLVKFIEKDMQQ